MFGCMFAHPRGALCCLYEHTTQYINENTRIHFRSTMNEREPAELCGGLERWSWFLQERATLTLTSVAPRESEAGDWGPGARGLGNGPGGGGAKPWGQWSGAGS